MKQALDRTDHYLDQFEQLERDGMRPSWLPAARREAIACFAELGFPTTRDEEWRYTSVQAIAQTTFQLDAGDTSSVPPEQLEPLILPGMAAVLVFVDGRHCPQYAPARTIPAGVEVANLTEVAAQGTAALESNLAMYAAYESNPFVALNTAFVKDGAFVHIPRGVVIDAPIQLLYVSTGVAGPPRMTQPRNLIVADACSQATIIESYAGLNGGRYCTNTVTEIIAGDSSAVDHYKIGQESNGALHIGALQIHQERDSHVSSHVASLGGLLVRNDIGSVLAGEGGDCTLTGLYLADQKQHVDNHLVVDHAKPHCNSREYFRGVLDGHGRGVFSGRIIVREQAQKTDAKQTNKSLLLSKDAQVESKPQLEIFADDVKCTHGATIGQVSEEAVFYLRTRGLAEPTARSLLVAAFARESLADVRPAELRKRLDAMVLARLPHGQLLRETA